MSDPLWSRFSADPRTLPHVRASDIDRAVVSDVLSDAYAQGRIDVDEFDERTEKASTLKTLGEVPDLIDDLIIAEPNDLPPGPLNDAARAQALARLTDDQIPITPEQIDAAAQKYYKDRVRRALIGMIAGPAGLTTAIWATISILSSDLQFFWPIFVIIPMLLGAVSQITGKDELIRKRKRELTNRARAHLGDVEAQRALEQHRGESGVTEGQVRQGPQPPHPLAPPFAPGHTSSRDEMRRRREERRRRRRDSWD